MPKNKKGGGGGDWGGDGGGDEFPESMKGMDPWSMMMMMKGFELAMSSGGSWGGSDGKDGSWKKRKRDDSDWKKPSVLPKGKKDWGAAAASAAGLAWGKKADGLEPFKRAFVELPEDSPGMREVVEAERGVLEVTVDGGEGADIISPVSTFQELGVLPEYALTALEGMGITEPMPIQAQALPVILSGHDLVGVAKTGSGKTLAYLLPALVHIEAQEPLKAGAKSPIALALAPTRELAVQISEEAQKLVKPHEGNSEGSSSSSSHPGGVWSSCIYGGLDKWWQLKKAAGAHIIAATPGRLMDVVSDGSLSMDRVTYLVLDEGDRMLDEGFEDQMRSIASRIREDRHMLFFSATWPKKVQDLAKNLCQSGQRPMRIRVGQSNESGATSREDIVQEVVVFDDGDWGERDVEKQKFLATHLREALEQEGTKVLVFVSTKDLAEKMSWQFHKEGFPASALHGGRSQDQRMRELEKFKNSEVRLLVTTDVMGRGLDIPSISHVVVYDMGDVDDYVHRIGRTARGPYGKGHALTLFEYNPKWPHLAEGLVLCLEAAGQHVPPELRKVAEEVERGEREVKAMKAGSKWGALSGWQGSAKDVAQAKLGYDGKDWGKDWGSW